MTLPYVPAVGSETLAKGVFGKLEQDASVQSKYSTFAFLEASQSPSAETMACSAFGLWCLPDPKNFGT